jgi:hypothetical protein
MGYHLNRAHNVLEWTVTDTEIPSDNPYPTGVTHIDVDHTLESSFVGGGGLFTGRGFKSWSTDIQGEIKIAPGVDRSHAWFVFRLILEDRLAKATLGNYSNTDRNNAKITRTGSYVPKKMRLKENIYTRTFSFKFSYLLLSDLDILLSTSSGLFQPVTTNNWNAWHSSLSNVFDSRGAAELGHLPSDDVIVDLCSQNIS